MKIKHCIHALLLTGAILLSSCVATRDVSFTINSEPPGAHVTMEIDAAQGPHPPIVFLGYTPIVQVSTVDIGQARSAVSVKLTAMREGYFEQEKTWTGQRFVEEVTTKGGIFWNPALVPMNLKSQSR